MIDLLEIKIILGRPSIIYISMVLFMFIEGDEICLIQFKKKPWNSITE